MKKLLGIFILIGFTFGFIGCNSDDDGPAEPQFNIVGTWKVSGKLINDVPQDISEDCVYKGNMKFVSGGIYVEDVWNELDGQPCELIETIGGNWVQNLQSYKITITTTGGLSILPQTFTPEIENNNFNRFKISATSLGTTTSLIFTRQ